MIIAPILNKQQRMEFNKKLQEFVRNHHNIRPETAEKICFNQTMPFMMGSKLFINVRSKSQYGTLDTINKTLLDVTKLERGLRDLSLWCLVSFKQICSDQGLRFDVDDIDSVDFKTGVNEML